MRIQAPWGESLSRIWRVVGGSYPIRKFAPGDIQLTTELGHVVVGERLRSTIVNISPGATAQSTDFHTLTSPGTELPKGPFRVHGVAFVMLTTDGTWSTDMALANLNVADGTLDNMLPLAAWTAVGGSHTQVFLDLLGGGILTYWMANLVLHTVPTLLLGQARGTTYDFTDRISRLVFSGRTAAFGAGTVTPYALVHITHYDDSFGSEAPRGSPSTPEGLPIPGW
jgi:hypothetical protein